MSKKKISIVSPTFNEELNIEDFFNRVVEVIDPHSHRYDFEIIIIDNSSTDNTVLKLKQIASRDNRLKIIINTRNFGHIRSPYYGILQSRGDATVYLASDLQDPPELIVDFIRYWEHGYKLVMAVKPASQSNAMFHKLRKIYYRILDKISEIPVIKDSTGFGLYDKKIINYLKDINDPYPFLRGLIAEIGYPVKTIEFNQPRRERGLSKNNFYSLYDIAWLGLVGHSKVPIRISAFLGILCGIFSVFIAFIFLILKLMFWQAIPLGIAPLVIGMFFLFGVQFILIGILGEYVGAILTYVQKRPPVIELERVNFDEGSIDVGSKNESHDQKD